MIDDRGPVKRFDGIFLRLAEQAALLNQPIEPSIPVQRATDAPPATCGVLDSLLRAPAAHLPLLRRGSSVVSRHSLKLISALTAAGYGLASPVIAQDTLRLKLHGCSLIKDRDQKIACYEQATIDAKAPPPPAAALSAVPKQWRIRESRSPIDDSVEVLAFTAAENAHSPQPPPGGTRATLMIACRDEQTMITVNVNDLIASVSGVSVVHRVGSAPAPSSAGWTSDQSGRTVGLWSSDKSVPVIRRMLSADRFFIRTEAPSLGATEATFDVRGLSKFVDRIAAACGWSVASPAAKAEQPAPPPPHATKPGAP
jgi:hypothetical protein